MHSNITNYVGRFAPTPNGPLHFGSVIAAVASYVDAKHHQGRWLLRFDDLDHTRCNTQHVDTIKQQLEWLGLYADGEHEFQQQHVDDYRDAIEGFLRDDNAYWCDCSRSRIHDNARLGPMGAIYPNTCRSKDLNSNQGRMIRLKTNADALTFNDLILGEQRFHLDQLTGDFVLFRADQVIAYHLATVMDDQRMGITHVIRGADLLPSTANQQFIASLLKQPLPTHGHFPVAMCDVHHKYSKSHGSKAFAQQCVGSVLYDALTFLGQNPNPEMVDASAEEVLAWAIQHWNLTAIPAIERLPFRPKAVSS